MVHQPSRCSDAFRVVSSEKRTSGAFLLLKPEKKKTEVNSPNSSSVVSASSISSPGVNTGVESGRDRGESGEGPWRDRGGTEEGPGERPRWSPGRVREESGESPGRRLQARGESAEDVPVSPGYLSTPRALNCLARAHAQSHARSSPALGRLEETGGQKFGSAPQ